MKARTAGSMPRRLGNTTCTIPCGLFHCGSTRKSLPLARSSRTALSGKRAIPTPASTARAQHDEVMTHHARLQFRAHDLTGGTHEFPGIAIQVARVIERLMFGELGGSEERRGALQIRGRCDQ